MKTSFKKKLTLVKKNIAQLSSEDAGNVRGGAYVSQVVKCGSGWCGYGTCLASASKG